MAAAAKLIAKYEICKQKLNKNIQNCTKKQIDENDYASLVSALK